MFIYIYIYIYIYILQLVKGRPPTRRPTPRGSRKGTNGVSTNGVLWIYRTKWKVGQYGKGQTGYYYYYYYYG